jgi:hypothetical protein
MPICHMTYAQNMAKYAQPPAFPPLLPTKLRAPPSTCSAVQCSAVQCSSPTHRLLHGAADPPYFEAAARLHVVQLEAAHISCRPPPCPPSAGPAGRPARTGRRWGGAGTPRAGAPSCTGACCHTPDNITHHNLAQIYINLLRHVNRYIIQIS